MCGKYYINSNKIDEKERGTVLPVPFLPSKTLMFYQMTLKIKRIMQGVTLLVIAVIFG